MNNNDLEQALNELFNSQPQVPVDFIKHDAITTPPPATEPQAQEVTPAGKELRNKSQAILATYRQQNEMRKRSNQSMTAFLKGINSDKPLKDTLAEAVDLIAILTDDKAYTTSLKKKMREAYDIPHKTS